MKKTNSMEQSETGKIVKNSCTRILAGGLV